MNLYEIYKAVLADKDKWNPTLRGDIDHDIENIFKYPCSYNFVVELFWGDSDLRPLVFDINKISNCVSQLRINHTISLYLLGIAIAEKIGFEKFQLPNWDSNPQRNFLHHWLAICLFHDIGYAIEDYYINEKLNDVSTLEDLSRVMGLTYRLDLLQDSDLTRKYYAYRIKECNKADHGIAGAMILYNSLMAANEKKKDIERTAIIFSEKPITGEHILKAIELFSNSIAKHNMWFASQGQEDIYNKYGLEKIIPKKDGTHLISFEQDSMLYLLCLADTIEPLKIYCKQSAIDVLQQVDIEIGISENSEVTLTADRKCSEILTKMKTLPEWLNCACEDICTDLRFCLSNNGKEEPKK